MKAHKHRPGHCAKCGRAVIFIASKNGVQVPHDPMILDGVTVTTVMMPHAHPKTALQRAVAIISGKE